MAAIGETSLFALLQVVCLAFAFARVPRTELNSNVVACCANSVSPHLIRRLLRNQRGGALGSFAKCFTVWGLGVAAIGETSLFALLQVVCLAFAFARVPRTELNSNVVACCANSVSPHLIRRLLRNQRGG